MSARDELYNALTDYEAESLLPGEANRLISAFAHELAERVRSARGRCVNDTDGDGDCAACARDPKAPCRPPLSGAQAADFIDPEVS